jgi:hypothetical protein
MKYKNKKIDKTGENSINIFLLNEGKIWQFCVIMH